MLVMMTLSDPKRRDVRGQIFQADLCNYTWAVWPRMAKIGR